MPEIDVKELRSKGGDGVQWRNPCFMKFTLPMDRTGNRMESQSLPSKLKLVVSNKGFKNNHLSIEKPTYGIISLYLSGFPDHDVVIVTISDSQDISSYTVASAGQRKFLYCFFKFAPSNNNTRERLSQKWFTFKCTHRSTDKYDMTAWFLLEILWWNQSPTNSGFLDFSQLSRASLLKAAVAAAAAATALLLLLSWIFAMVSEFFTTSMRPILLPVDRQPYGIILCMRWQEHCQMSIQRKTSGDRVPPPPHPKTHTHTHTAPEVQALFLP